MNVVEKIISSHIVDGDLNSSTEIGIKIDQTLTQDATGTMAYLEFEAIGIDSIKTELSVSYIDHNTIQDGFENADDHAYLKSIAEKYGIVFSKAGNGICHQVHLENFARPGKTLLGSDSHTPTAGGIGMIAIGAGGLDVATALAGGAFYIPVPKIMRIELTGKLSPFVSAKDIILKILQILTTKGNVGYIIEYGGEALENLSVPERATITNMGAELGVTTSVFPSDKITKSFLKAQGREDQFVEIIADPGAEYEKVITLDVGDIRPMVALPHSPDNVKEVSELKDVNVDQVLIGSCTNSSYKDLVTVTNLLKGKKVNNNLSFGVAPGSKQVFEMISNEGYLFELIKSGARILESTCGFCIGLGQAPMTDAVSLRTNNRNFLGRSGTKSAGIFLVSPETAAASAITGKITDPAEFFNEDPGFKRPDKYPRNNSLLIFPEESEGESIEIKKGPNIGAPPLNTELKNSLNCRVAIKVKDKITTDHIMPAGSFLKYRSNIKKYSEYVFNSVDSDFPLRCTRNMNEGFVNVIIAGESYGQGSSREHAAICPMNLGVRLVISKTIERIHRANLINFGIIPLEFINENDYEMFNLDDELKLNGIIGSIADAGEIEIFNVTKDKMVKAKGSFSEREISNLLAGGKLNELKRKEQEK